MPTRETQQQESPSAARQSPRPAPPYEPPAVAWEEPFEPLAADSYCTENPLDPLCNT